ncbi:hypothetical protein [Aurantiacibacter gangjinensis]|uniref:Uncharacterized protein n=1 Tax=Aurantiacibacter gangjinensis TaxID=502682 RepID=A0A0G9MRS3_9SPHN|nr:hypothetical protein [Aurantiacibacter gangjinensis]APE26952.1 hypothetical protein BMF35_a0123 [Aurantiacibacter gangjinensis]KLE33405.1 hypothetical protein AAW01_05615 [Aurantiacibacter gangjinensis]
MKTALLLPLTLLFASPLAAQDAVPSPTPEAAEAARFAQERGQLMQEVLRTTGVAQGQYQGMVAGDIGTGYKGAIALRGDAADTWRTLIFGQPGGDDAPLVAFAEYEIFDYRILSERIYPINERPELQGDALAMARGQIVAPRAVIAHEDVTFCINEDVTPGGQRIPFATLTFAMPPDDRGAFDVYVLNGPFDARFRPLGKHYKVHFDEFGVLGDPQLLTDTCEVVEWERDAAGLAETIYPASHDGQIAPSEVHVFLSAQLPMPLGVMTDGTMWPVQSGMIGSPVAAPAAE